MNRLFVPDASVILKWVLPPENEPNSQEALAILDQFVAGDIVLAVPSLWYFEVGNTLARLVPQEAGEYLKQLRRLRITEAEIGPSVEQTVLGYVQRFGVTFYDAAYHAVASNLGGTLVTADLRYVKRVSPDPGVMELGMWKTEW